MESGVYAPTASLFKGINTEAVQHVPFGEHRGFHVFVLDGGEQSLSTALLASLGSGAAMHNPVPTFAIRELPSPGMVTGSSTVQSCACSAGSHLADFIVLSLLSAYMHCVVLYASLSVNVAVSIPAAVAGGLSKFVFVSFPFLLWFGLPTMVTSKNWFNFQRVSVAA